MQMTCNPSFDMPTCCNCFQLSTDTLEEHIQKHIRHIIHVRRLAGFPEMTQGILHSIAISFIDEDSPLFPLVSDPTHYNLTCD